MYVDLGKMPKEVIPDVVEVLVQVIKASEPLKSKEETTMEKPIYIIAIDGEPYTADGRIRTYKTVDNATREAKRLKQYHCYKDHKIEIGEFVAFVIEEVTNENH
jgi:hypothetical protein